MMRMRSLVWLLAVAALGFGTYGVKYRVQGLDEELSRTIRQIREDEGAIHVLKAEWSFLNQPARLDELAQRHLLLAPIATRQLGQIASIPVKRAPERNVPETVPGQGALAFAPSAGSARPAAASGPARPVRHLAVAATAPAVTPSPKPQFMPAPLPAFAAPRLNVASARIRTE